MPRQTCSAAVRGRWVRPLLVAVDKTLEMLQVNFVSFDDATVAVASAMWSRCCSVPAPDQESADIVAG